ncbi:MAG TPA: nucleoside monophosphate kinase [Candidatus Saccharimonadales bacterium]|nr:nucleoside monophosphate kinase [Candidatus Saccharimonadales bacterium]
MAVELLLLGGAPGSGKSTIAKQFVANEYVPGARHLSVGERKRAILRGEVASRYKEALSQKAYHDRISGTVGHGAMIGMVEEYIEQEPDGLVVLDGFPRYRDRVDSFRQSIDRLGARVLGLCIVEVPEHILRERLVARPVRSEQAASDPTRIDERLADHYHHIVPTLDMLSARYPSCTLDGTEPPAVNAAVLRTMYYGLTG